MENAVLSAQIEALYRQIFPLPVWPQEANLQDCLRRAMGNMQGATGRWALVRERGCLEADILECLRFQWGLGGGCCGWREDGSSYDYAYRGGNKPAFWATQCLCHGKPDLTGKALIQQVRQMLRPQEENSSLSQALAG